MTRCRIGDLAIIVGDDASSNIGKFVHVIARANGDDWECYEGEEWECVSESGIVTFGDDGWNWMPPGKSVAWHDDCLRPIRDQPGEDETLSWAEVPRGVAA